MKKAGLIFFWSAIFLGLVIRLFSIPYLGIFDMAVYNEWGLATANNGLVESYHGIYFPFQYQIFGFGSWLANVLNTEYYIVYKSINLIFDCGSLFVLFLILKKFEVSRYYLLIYWIHPWFLNMFSLGYIDFQFTFFILCSLYFTFRDTARDYLIAGIFLAFAFLMKPQAQIIFLSFFIYGVIRYYRRKEISVFHIFIFPVIMFINYSLYFLITSGNPFRLAWTYLKVADHMPCLNANCLNGWFPVAFLMKGENEPIYSVSDELTFLGIPYRFLAILLVLTLIYHFIKRVADENAEPKRKFDLFYIACFAAFAVPFLMTSAHENHLFLGTVLIIPILAVSKNFIFKASIHIILMLQFINLYGFYRIGEIKNIHLPDFNYPYDTTMILSIIAFISYLIMLYHLLIKKSKLFLL
jgi:hypothetical protein